VLPAPDVDVDGVEDEEDSKAPPDGVDDDPFAGREELVDEEADEEKVDKRPDPESVWCRGQISFLSAVVDIVGTSNGVDVGSEQEEVGYDIDDLEEDAI